MEPQRGERQERELSVIVNTPSPDVLHLPDPSLSCAHACCKRAPPRHANTQVRASQEHTPGRGLRSPMRPLEERPTPSLNLACFQ
ncbi:unnamed protein product [Mesocestoides corti]|uniref:Uncharacterized protein n=1 Tax=Mesocestoides corti TaxID=53468 RepID=A0A0R3U3S0_MESCO|nr:unnamed protein product [Mesocestoides corti]